MQGHANLMVPYHLHVFMGISDWAGLQELSQPNYPSTLVVLYYVHTSFYVFIYVFICQSIQLIV